MSTLDDLRRTLDRHADDLVDTGAPGRPDAVRGRVRAVRRRRQGLAVAGAAAAVAAVALATLPAGSPSTDPPDPADPDRTVASPDADRTLGDHRAPATLTSLGFGYDFVTGAADPSVARLHLDPSEQPRLVTWATTQGGVELTEEAPGEADVVWTSSRTDFDDFTFVPPGAEATYTAFADDVALAVYELGDEGLVFRDQVGDARALGSAVGNQGEADLSLDVRPVGGVLQLSTVCAHGAGGYTHLSVDGEERWFGPGCDDSTFDPGGQGGITVAATGASVALRWWVTDGRDGPLLDDDDVRLAVGAYALGDDAQSVAGTAVPQVREHDGHLWELSGATESSPGSDRIDAPTEDGVPTLVALSWTGSGNATVQPLVDGRPDGPRFAVGSGGTVIGDGLLTTGVDVGARVEGDAAEVRLGLAFYRRLD